MATLNFTRILNGMQLVPQNNAAPTSAGELRYNSTTNRLELFSTSLSPIVTESTISSVPLAPGLFTQLGSDPAPPAAGFLNVFSKINALFIQDPSGLVSQLSTVGTGGIVQALEFQAQNKFTYGFGGTPNTTFAGGLFNFNNGSTGNGQVRFAKWFVDATNNIDFSGGAFRLNTGVTGGANLLATNIQATGNIQTPKYFYDANIHSATNFGFVQFFTDAAETTFAPIGALSVAVANQASGAATVFDVENFNSALTSQYLYRLTNLPASGHIATLSFASQPNLNPTDASPGAQVLLNSADVNAGVLNTGVAGSGGATYIAYGPDETGGTANSHVFKARTSANTVSQIFRMAPSGFYFGVGTATSLKQVGSQTVRASALDSSGFISTTNGYAFSYADIQSGTPLLIIQFDPQTIYVGNQAGGNAGIRLLSSGGVNDVTIRPLTSGGAGGASFTSANGVIFPNGTAGGALSGALGVNKLGVRDSSTGQVHPAVVSQNESTSLKIVRGQVQYDYTVGVGVGFTVQPHVDDGIYEIVFDQAFASAPTVVASEVQININADQLTVNVSNVTTTGAKFHVQKFNGTIVVPFTPYAFDIITGGNPVTNLQGINFIAIGPR